MRLTERQMRKVIDTNRRYRECKEADTHPTRSGMRETRLLAGHEVLMERCAVCDVLTPALEGKWIGWGED